MPELNLVQDFLSGLTLPSLRKRIALSVKVDKDQSPIARGEVLFLRSIPFPRNSRLVLITSITPDLLSKRYGDSEC